MLATEMPKTDESCFKTIHKIGIDVARAQSFCPKWFAEVETDSATELAMGKVLRGGSLRQLWWPGERRPAGPWVCTP